MKRKTGQTTPWLTDNSAVPNYKLQLRKAREMLRDKGPDALLNPHAMTGRICGCRDCFCCAALEIYNESAKIEDRHNRIKSRQQNP
jgi:hypothetical protein